MATETVKRGTLADFTNEVHRQAEECRQRILSEFPAQPIKNIPFAIRTGILNGDGGHVFVACIEPFPSWLHEYLSAGLRYGDCLDRFPPVFLMCPPDSA